MMSLLIYLFCVVYPLKQGEIVKEPLVAFDTLSAKKLLYYLDSLEYVTEKYKKLERVLSVSDSLIKSYQATIETLKKINENLEKQLELMSKELKNLQRRLWLERFIWIGSVVWLIIILK